MAETVAVIAVPAELLRRVLAQLQSAETSAGHLAQRVMHEHLGYCSWRGCGERCRAHRALVDELGAALEDR